MKTERLEIAVHLYQISKQNGVCNVNCFSFPISDSAEQVQFSTTGLQVSR